MSFLGTPELEKMQETKYTSPGRLNIWLPLLFAAVLVAGMLIGMRLQSQMPTVVSDIQSGAVGGTGQHSKIEELLRYIEAKYVQEVDRNQLIDEAINSILRQLDPHSSYITSDQLQEVNDQLDGNFDGIGVEFIILEDTVVVVAPLSGGPAQATGVLAGDQIVEVEDSIIAGNGITSAGVMRLLRGAKGSEVRIGILRGQETNVRYFRIRRDAIPVHSVDAAYMLDDKTGYIKISRFSATTHEEFMRKLETLVDKKGMKDLVIDLRQNPGGYLQQATNILSQLFRQKDKLLVYTEGRAVHRNNYETTGRALFHIDKIAVLIDEGSASASEIVAGALQDQDRAYIIGRRSFGKGLVQEQYALRDGSALRLTIARYYTPSGRSIQKPYKDLDKYQKDLLERYHSGELASETKLQPLDTTPFYTASGRVVYGGGGIMPDIFVPLDTMLFNPYFNQLRPHIPQFSYRYVNTRRASLQYNGLEQFKRNFKVNDELLQQLLAYAEEHGLKSDTRQLALVKSEIQQLLKAHIARHLFDESAFYIVLNEEDAMIKTALQTLRRSSPLTQYQQKHMSDN